MNLSSPFIHRPVATTLLTVAIAIAGAIAFTCAAGVAAAAGGFSDDLGECRSAGRERGDHGVVGGDAAGAAVRPYRRRHGDDVFEQPGHDVDHDAV